MLQLQLYQIKITQNCLSNQNLALKEQLTEININQKYQHKDKTHI